MDPNTPNTQEFASVPLEQPISYVQQPQDMAMQPTAPVPDMNRSASFRKGSKALPPLPPALAPADPIPAPGQPAAPMYYQYDTASQPMMMVPMQQPATAVVTQPMMPPQVMATPDLSAAAYVPAPAPVAAPNAEPSSNNNQESAIVVGYNFEAQSRTLVEGLTEGAAWELAEYRNEQFEYLKKGSERSVEESEKQGKKMIIGIILSVVWYHLGCAIFWVGLIISAAARTVWWIIFLAIIGGIVFFVSTIVTIVRSLQQYFKTKDSNKAVQAYLRPGNKNFSTDPNVVSTEESCLAKKQQIIREENAASFYGDIPREMIQRYYIYTWEEDKEIEVNGVKIRTKETKSIARPLGVHQCDNFGRHHPALLCPSCAIQNQDTCFKCHRPSSVLSGPAALGKAMICNSCADDSLKYICVGCYRFVGRGPRITARICGECNKDCCCVRSINYVM